MASIVDRLFREGTRRGLQGSQGWAAVAAASGAVRVLRRITNPPPDVMWRQAMLPGDRFEITVKEPPPTRRQRRKAKKKVRKTDKKAAAKAERTARRERKRR